MLPGGGRVGAPGHVARALDTITIGIEEPDGTFVELASLDGKYLSTEVAGGFTGRVIGMFAGAGSVHFDWFEYEPVDR